MSFKEKGFQILVRFLSFLLLPGNNENLFANKIKRILVYGQMGIGNMILFTPFLRSLRFFFSDSQIILLLLNKNGAEQVLEGSNLVDKIIIWDKDKLSYLQILKKVLEMAKWRPDLVITRFNSDYIGCVLITLLSRARYRVGHVSSGGWQGIYDHTNNYPAKMKDNEHEIERYIDLASSVGIQVSDYKPSFYISRDDEKSAQSFLVKYFINDSEPFVTIHIGTNPHQRWKQWDTAKWVILTEKLLQKNIKVVALGSSDERDMIIKAFSKSTPKPIIAAGDLTLKQSGAIIKKSGLLVCSDSGLMHVSVAVDTPVVAIYGPTDYTRTAPLGNKHTIIRKDLPCSPCFALDGLEEVENCKNRVCLESIKVEEVLKILLLKLKKISAS